ncbi:hypothetical protein D9M69_532110 [compost metagenome]
MMELVGRPAARSGWLGEVAEQLQGDVGQHQRVGIDVSVLGDGLDLLLGERLGLCRSVHRRECALVLGDGHRGSADRQDRRGIEGC